ncbi:MAG: hypothetical protein K9N11_03640 [Lentisphaeria bacterium]|nr:hypothetical protein [Candidatus Neomarinimicrobiota bacterium]MCF7841927.1 hypothetical protein [Lentisphaeria bacterium]
MRKIILIITFTALALTAADRGTIQMPTPPESKSDVVGWNLYNAKMKQIHRMSKAAARSDRAYNFHNGNQVRTLFYNYGSIGKPNTEPSMEWPIGSGRGYAFEFGVVAGAEVPTYGGDTKRIVIDGLTVAGVSGNNPAGTPNDWEPLPGYNDPFVHKIAMSDSPDEDRDPDARPDTWPPYKTSNNPFWYQINDATNPDYPGKFVWPGEYGRGVTTADQESYYVMDDSYVYRHNSYPWTGELRDDEFYADLGNPDRGGIGLEVESRGYQWIATRAQNVIFFIYELENTGGDTLESVYFGMYGDPHIGGANDYSDDDAYYDTYVDMVYAWDDNARGGPEFADIIPGFFGYKFLESPGEPYDFVDNDQDGMVDESMQDGIDNDGDWRPFDDYNNNGQWDPGEAINDDVGTDGLGPEDPGYPGPDADYTEANGRPDDGEPNFDQTDLDEADQIGLTGFIVEQYSYNGVDDNTFFNRLAAPIIDSTFQQRSDNIFLYSSGPLKMAPGDRRRFSITMLFGYNITGATGVDLHENPHNTRDLYATANVVQDIYNAGYRFTRPPLKPRITAVPGDEQVTLYWDEGSEHSKDPIYGNDFAGYAIYRATDFGFEEVKSITDAYGSPYLWKPIAKFDKIDSWRGPHPIEQVVGSGLHYDMGSNTGLVHSFVDKDVINGQRYYYAICAYDTGSVRDTIPPTETSKNIQETFSGEITLDINTAVVTPAAPSVGYVAPEVLISDDVSENPGTGSVEVKIIDPMQVPHNREYAIRFVDSRTDMVDNDGDWKSFMDDTLFIPVGSYVTLIVPPTPDTVNFVQNQDTTVAVTGAVGEHFVYSGLWWEINQLISGTLKDSVIIPDTTITVLPTLDIWNPLTDGSVNQDVGMDGCSDIYEISGGGCSDAPIAGVNPGDDPHGDNWHPVLNPGGTEANGRPDAGEPNVDDNDIQEKVRETQYFQLWDITDPADELIVLDRQDALQGEDKNHIMNGLQVFVHNDVVAQDSANTGWISGNASWDANITLSRINNVDGIPFPGNYQIHLTADTADTIVLPSPRPITFYVMETLSGDTLDIGALSLNGTTFGLTTALIPLMYETDDKTGNYYRTWDISFRPRTPGISAIVPDENGLLIGTRGVTNPNIPANGLHYYSPETGGWKHWSKASTGGNLIDNTIYDIKSVGSAWWIGTGWGPVAFDGIHWYRNFQLETLFDILNGGVEDLSNPEASRRFEACIAIATDQQGYIWLATAKKGLVRVNTNGTLETSLDDEIVQYTTPATVDIDITTRAVRDILVDDQNRLWIATEAGLVIYDIDADSWSTIKKTNDNGLPNNNFQTVYQLPDGTIVVGTSLGLAFKVDDNFVTYDDLPNKTVYSFYYDEAQTGKTLWVGTKKGFATIDLTNAGTDYAGLTTTQFEASYGDTSISQDADIRSILFIDGEGWFGTNAGLEHRITEEDWDSFGPEPGDVFQYKTRMPFSAMDSYKFTTSGGQESAELVKNDLDQVAVVPNPYVATATWERKPYLQSGRGERKVYFINLPQECTIRIYTVSGELVRKIEHSSTVYDGSEPWDLLNNDNLEVAYGIYVYHIESPESGAETIGKLALIK